MPNTVEQVLQQIWTDPDTKQKLEADPKAFLKDLGVDIPAGTKVVLHEDSPTEKHFVLPEKIEADAPVAQDPVVNVVQRAMKDSAFKAKLMSDPKSTVRDMGVAIPDDISLKVYQNSSDTTHLVLPSNPANSELSDADLEAVAGGMSKSSQLNMSAAVTGGALGAAAAGVGIASAVGGFTLVGLAICAGVGGGLAIGGAVAGGATAAAGTAMADKGK